MLKKNANFNIKIMMNTRGTSIVIMFIVQYWRHHIETRQIQLYGPGAVVWNHWDIQSLTDQKKL